MTIPAAMRDVYTLVVPTYNRPRPLAALLRYLEHEGATFPILVLDSSAHDHRDRNRRLIGTLSLDLTLVEYEPSTKPFDKFRDGIARVRTEFAGLCADDDIVIVQGVSRCVDHLQRHPDHCVAHGYYFTFLDDSGDRQRMHLTDIPYYAPSIASNDPLSRLRDLFRNYQALTYGTYRTLVLQHIFATVRPVESLLARELLSSALAVVRGKAARLPWFTNGRSLDASEAYRHWHPLEWLIDSPEGLFAEYLRYRELLVRELMATATHARDLASTVRIVDLIHMVYLFRHAPAETHDFILDNVIAGKDTYDFWPSSEIQVPLIHASRAADAHSAAVPDAWTQALGGSLRRFARLLRHPREAVTTRQTAQIGTRTRDYRLHDRFVSPRPEALITITDDDRTRLLATLDAYRPSDATAP